MAVAAVPQLENAPREPVDNAARHAETDPWVRITADAIDGGIDLTVADECPPLPASEIEVLGGEGSRSATHHRAGIGLWLVYWTVELSDGETRIDAARERRRGNRIALRLPATPTDPDAGSDGPD